MYGQNPKKIKKCTVFFCFLDVRDRTLKKNRYFLIFGGFFLVTKKKLVKRPIIVAKAPQKNADVREIIGSAFFFQLDFFPTVFIVTYFQKIPYFTK